MYIGPFYFDTKELFLMLAAIILVVAVYLDWPLWVYKPQSLLTLAIIMLLTKGLLKSINNDVFFFHAIVTLLLALFVSTFQIILFYLVSFSFFRALKVI